MDVIRKILEETTTIVVVGASDIPGKPANFVPAEMQEAGYRIIPVNPTVDEVLGEESRPSIAAVDEPIDLVNVFRRAPEVPAVVRDAIEAGAKAIWVQQGIVSPEGRALAEEAGLLYVEDRCIATERRRYGIHRLVA